MLLTALPALVCLTQSISPKEALVTTAYELRHVSPAYFLQELDDPKKHGRPQGIESIRADNRLSTITVKATPAGHTALKLLLAETDTVTPKFEQPKYVLLLLQGKKDSKVVLEMPLYVEENKPLLVGLQYNQAEIAEQEKRPLACRVPVKPEVNLILTPHLSTDGTMVRLERKLERFKPRPEIVPLSDLTVNAGQRTALDLGDALPASFQELSVIASPDSTNFSTVYQALKQRLTQQKELPIFAETRVQLKRGDEVVETPIIAHPKEAVVEFSLFPFLLPEQCLWIVPHFSADEKTAQLEYFLLTKQRLGDSLIPLGTQTVTVGANTRMIFHPPLVFGGQQEFFIRVKRANPDNF